MEKTKIMKILKRVSKILSLALLIIIITFGLGLLFVFVSTKAAQSKGAEPPINLYTIISPSMTPNINVYDVVVTIKTDPSKLKVNDVISFYSSNPNVGSMTITHRIVKITEDGDSYQFTTKGDYNKAIDEEVIDSLAVVGKVYFRIPQLGRVQFFLGSKGGWLFAILIPALAIIAYDIYKIIKLVMIKQKIVSFQKQGQTSEEPTENYPPEELAISNNPPDNSTHTYDALLSENIDNKDTINVSAVVEADRLNDVPQENNLIEDAAQNKIDDVRDYIENNPVDELSRDKEIKEAEVINESTSIAYGDELNVHDSASNLNVNENLTPSDSKEEDTIILDQDKLEEILSIPDEETGHQVE